MLFDSGVKHWRIAYDGGVLTEKDLFSAQIEIRQSIMSSDTLRFGGCEASSMTFSVFNDGRSFLGQELNVSVECEGRTSRFGFFIVKEEELASDRESRKVTAYDALYDILNRDCAAWYNNFFNDGAVTMRQFRDGFFAWLGIQQAEESLIFDGLSVSKVYDVEAITCGTILKSLCEINGVFGRINEAGLFEYVSLEETHEGLHPHDGLFPGAGLNPYSGSGFTKIEANEYINASFADYKVEQIDKVQIRAEEADIGGIAGTGENAYIIQGNMFMLGKDAEALGNVAQALLNKIGVVTYKPSNIKAFYDDEFRMGDAISYDTRHGSVITYILNRVISGVQSMRATYSAEGKRQQAEKVASVNNSLVQLQGRTNRLVRTVDELSSTISDTARNLETQILQNAEAITLRVRKDSIVSEINQTAETIKIQASKIDLVGLVNATEFETKYATIGDLNATDAYIDRVAANSVTTSELNATNARITSLESDHVSVGSLNALSAEVSGKLSAGELSSAITNIDMVTIGGSLKVGAYSVSWQEATVQGGKKIYYLGRS